MSNLPHFSDAQAYLASMNYSFDIVPDGELHRFSRNGSKDSGWYLAWQNTMTKSGEPYLVIAFGDWREGKQTHIYKPAGKLSKADEMAVNERIKEARKKQQEEKQKRHTAAAEKAGKIWSLPSSWEPTEYTKRKLIMEPYGTRTYNGTLQVPIKDIDGRLWGTQYIMPAEKDNKRFATGTKIEECMHVIGGPLEDGMEIFACEGFATGASIYAAMGRTTVCTFNSVNIVRVCRVIHERFPGIMITVCGDSDQWTMINNEPVNVGKIAAEDAAMIAHGSFVLPRFQSLDGHPTDFNDLHVREGIAAVREQLSVPKEREVGFIPLGYDENVYFFYNLLPRDIVRLSSFSATDLLKLASKNYWSKKYWKEKTGQVDWQSAVDDLIQLSQKVGPFDPTRIRGTGVWSDDGRTVVNTGQTLLVDGRKCGLTTIKSWFIYVQTRNRIPEIHSEPATVEDLKPLVDLCETLKWTDAKSGAMLAGWIAIARISAALPIRPHVWLSGGSGTGKSTVMNGVIAPALGSARSRIYLQGGSTEAGIRQTVKSNSMPLIFDEFEANDSALSRERNEAVVELLRNCWSASSGAMIKGSASGQSAQYQLAFSALVSSIRTTLTNDADRSRFSVLELKPHGDDTKFYGFIQQCMAHIDEEFGERLFARMVRMVNVVKQSHKEISRALAGVVSQRYGQQVGMLLAGYWALCCDEPLNEATASAMVNELGVSYQDAQVPDHVECLHHLLLTKVRVRQALNFVEESVVDVVLSSDQNKHADLKACGIRVKNGKMLIADSHPELMRIYSNTRWAKGWAPSLRRVTGAKQGNGMYINKAMSSMRYTEIDIETLTLTN